MSFGGFGGKFGDDFIEDSIAVLVAIDFDKESESLVMLEDGESFIMELFEAGAEDVEVFVV